MDIRSSLPSLNRTMIGLKDRTVCYTPDRVISLNRTMIGLKGM